GEVSHTKGDSIMLVSQNTAQNKIDWFLHREMKYAVQIEPAADGRTATVSGALTATLRNDAPTSGAPRSIIGPPEPLQLISQFPAGLNVSYTSLYTPLTAEEKTLNGKATGSEDERELGRNVYSVFVSTPSKTASNLELSVHGTTRLARGRWY